MVNKEVKEKLDQSFNNHHYVKATDFENDVYDEDKYKDFTLEELQEIVGLCKWLLSDDLRFAVVPYHNIFKDEYAPSRTHLFMQHNEELEHQFKKSVRKKLKFINRLIESKCNGK